MSYLHHQLHREFKNNNANTHHMRNKLQMQARDLLGQINKAIRSEKKEQMLIALGAATAYVKTRNELAPYLGSDGYTRDLTGSINKLKSLTKDAE